MGWTSYRLWRVIDGSSILGVVGSVVGSFAVLRRQSLPGGLLAHVELPELLLLHLKGRDAEADAPPGGEALEQAVISQLAHLA